MNIFTSIQVRDRKINDLKIQLSNEKNARKYDKELFEYKYAELKDIIAQKQEIIEMLQREISKLTIENNKKEEEIQALKKRIAELEDKVAVLESRIKKDSSNSSCYESQGMSVQMTRIMSAVIYQRRWQMNTTLQKKDMHFKAYPIAKK